MATKPGGAPYPLPTEPINQGAAAISALATFVDPAEMVLVNSGNRNATTGFSPMGWSAVGFTKGAGLSWTAQGITPAVSGRYRLEGWGSIQGNAAGVRRGIAFAPWAGTVSTGVPQPMVPPLGATGVNVALSATLSLTAGVEWTVWIYQDSGVTLLVSNLSFSVKREY